MGRASGRKNLPREPVPGPDTPEGRDIGESARQDPAGSPIPGLTGNIANYETVRRQVPVGESLPEYRGMMAHGVPAGSETTEERATMEREGTLAQHRPLGEPDVRAPRQQPPAIPVYLVERAGGNRPLTTLAGQKISVPAQGTEAARIAARDETRSEFYVQAEVVSSVTTATATFAATGGATATLPAGSSISGFDVSGGTPAGSSQINIVVSGVQGGPLDYFITGEGTAAEAYQVHFPDPLAPANPAVGISVTTTGSADSPAGAIVVYGRVSPLGIRVSHEVGDLDVGLGALIRPGAYQKLDGFQDELFAVSADSSPQVVSVITVFEVVAGA